MEEARLQDIENRAKSGINFRQRPEDILDLLAELDKIRCEYKAAEAIIKRMRNSPDNEDGVIAMVVDLNNQVYLLRKLLEDVKKCRGPLWCAAGKCPRCAKTMKSVSLPMCPSCLDKAIDAALR